MAMPVDPSSPAPAGEPAGGRSPESAAAPAPGSAPARPAGPPSPDLDAANVYRLSVDECWKDGRLEEPEAEFLKRLARLLGVRAADVEAIGASAQARAGVPATEPMGMDKERVLRSACRVAWRDKELEPAEAQLLRTLAHLLKIESFRVDRVIEEERRASGGAARARPEGGGGGLDEDSVPGPKPRDPLLFGLILAAFVPIFVLPAWLMVAKAGKLGPYREAGPWLWIMYAEVVVAVLTLAAWVLFRLAGERLAARGAGSSRKPEVRVPRI